MLVPVAAHLISGGFGWSGGDFLFAVIILFTSCLIFDLAARKAPGLAYLAGAGAALAAGFGSIVVYGAVGLVGSEGAAHKLWFLVVIAVGSAVARGRPEGMARAMFAAGVLHIAVSMALLIGPRGISDGDATVEVVGLAVFAAVWMVSAWLFRRSVNRT